MKKIALLSILASTLLLSGCYTPLIEGAQEGYDAASRNPLRTEAQSGDPIAQYKLGDTFCCHGGGPMDMVSIYDNPKATYWYCKAARQGYGPAQLRLARVYSGDPIHGLHIALRASALVGKAETDFGVAIMWATVAADHGVDGAAALREEIVAKSTTEERVGATSLMKKWRTAPCQWAEVIHSARTTIH